MAVDKAVWGIEIGQAGLKAIKLKYAAPAQQVLALAFDYVPHPKILSQPDAIPEELIRESLKTFLSRNRVEGDLISIALPGSTSLARFIQLPPVDASKVSEIIKYEAKQQIPFPLEEVFWDYQTIGSGSAEGGFLLDAEVGLFAMKKDKVFQALAPFTENKLEVELIQIAPLGVYNFVCYEELKLKNPDDVPTSDDYILVLDMGADSTTLMLTNGKRIWIRNVSLGGSHFTRALTKEMKLPFAKAEHLKINAIKSPDPKAVFQVLKPVFSEYVNEIQKSIGFFSSVNRNANISRVIGLGNGFKLAGLQKFLEQSLNYEVKKLETFEGLVGNAVLNAPLFKDNILTFAVPYGMALQLLERTSIQTSLLPPEITRDRVIRSKKPWAVVAAACLLIGLTLSAAGYANVQRSVSQDRWGKQISGAEELKKTVGGYESTYNAAEAQYKSLREEGTKLIVGMKDDTWLEFYHSLNSCLPRDPGDKVIDDIQKQNRVMITSINMTYSSDVSSWFTPLVDAQKLYMLPKEKEAPPTGEGYIVTLTGLHYHYDTSDPDHGMRTGFVVNTILKNLQDWTITIPGSPPAPVRKLGISHATLIKDHYRKALVPKKTSESGSRAPRYNALGNLPPPQDPSMMQPGMMQPGMMGGDSGMMNNPYGSGGMNPYGSEGMNSGMGMEMAPQASALPKDMTEEIPETDFVIQFIWKPTPVETRVDVDPLAPPPVEGTAETPPPAPAT